MPKRTPEQNAREAGEAMASSVMNALENIVLKLATRIGEQADELAKLRQRVDGIERLLETTGDDADLMTRAEVRRMLP
jgi:hypothetical protein